MTSEVPQTNVYSAMHDLAERHISEDRELDITDDVRAFAIEIAGDTVTLDDQEAVQAALELDDRANTDDRVTTEVIRSGKLASVFQRPRKQIQELCGSDVERSEAIALDNLRIALAIRRFRVGFPDRFNSPSDGYYSSEAFNRGSKLIYHLVESYLGRFEGQPDSVR